jgi:hypothetical protein
VSEEETKLRENGGFVSIEREEEAKKGAAEYTSYT